VASWLPVLSILRSASPGWVTAALALRVATASLLIAGVVMMGRAAGAEVPRFAAWVQSHGAWAPLAYIAGYVLLTVTFIPGALPTMAAGIIFGLVPGTVYAFIGETLGGVAAFWLARRVARPMAKRRLARSPRFATLDRAVAAQGRRIVMMLRLSPVVPFNVINYALGVTTIRFVDYLVASIAMLPGAFLYVYYGKLIGDVAALAGGAAVPHDRVYWTATLFGLAATVGVSVMLARIATRALRDASIVPPTAEEIVPIVDDVLP
jgi:uncharacterized membrane protein YdjX (TVP38/TMEM64 family)